MNLNNFFIACVVIVVAVVGQVRQADAECKIPTTKADFDVTRVSPEINYLMTFYQRCR